MAKQNKVVATRKSRRPQKTVIANKNEVINFPLLPINTTAGSGILSIDIAALKHNYKILQGQAVGAEVAAVVKADAYGLGIKVVATALYEAGCRLFFVAQAFEAFTLQHALAAVEQKATKTAQISAKIGLDGKQKSQNLDRSGKENAHFPDKRGKQNDVVIAILNDVLPEEAETVARAGFLPVLNSLESVRFWAALCRKKRRKFPAMLQCDSGMARLGLNKAELKELLHEPETLKAMKLQAILSHLACGDDETSPMNAAQKKLFLQHAAELSDAAGDHIRSIKLSLAASCGLALGKGFCLDIVRPGLALYGFIEGAGQGRQTKSDRLVSALQPVLTVEGRILRVSRLEKGETVGYGATYKATKTQPIATISLGYADGLPRGLSNRGAVYYQTIRLPIIGRISMDCLVVDLSPLLKAKMELPQRGALIELIGPHQTLHKLAQDGQTIPHALLTALGHRYVRRIIRR